jgi:hypothetical protein
MLRSTAPGETERRSDQHDPFVAAAIAVATLALFLRTSAPRSTSRTPPAFAYASSRFALAQALVEAGDVSGATRQVTALLALDPDDTEDRIAEAMKAIGHARFQHVALGVRARELLSVNR